MDDFISRKAVNALIKAECSPKVAAYLIDAVATIHAADVRPVVLCKDCVYAYPYGLEIKCTKHSGKADRFGEDATYSEFHSGNWYCADAQRKREKHGKV